jgi:surface polysaccharide O-acyltransferase-like enzyme
MATRIESIESLRVFAIVGVILWHTDLLLRLRHLGGGRWPVDLTIDLVWWVSLPYFFIVAGYFFGKSVDTDGHPIARLRHYSSSLIGILVAWVCVYAVIPSNWPVAVRDHGWWQPFQAEVLKNMPLLATQHIRLFLEGDLPVWHLWFLPALMFSLATVALISLFRLRRWVIPLMVGLYLLALTEEFAGGHFRNFTFHLGTWSVAILFTVLGSWVAGRGKPSLAMAGSVLVAGYAIAFAEWVVMKEGFHLASTYKHQYFGGIFLALGFFLLALAKPNLGRYTPLPFLAKFTLGVYISHILIIYTFTAVGWRLQNLFPGLAPVWPFLFPFIVYMMAVLFTFVISEVPFARYLVTRDRKAGLELFHPHPLFESLSHPFSTTQRMRIAKARIVPPYGIKGKPK